MGTGLIPGGKENDKPRQAVFFTPLDPFGNNPDEEKPHDDYAVPQKLHHKTCWKHNQDAFFWIKLSRAQDQGLQFWQTKSFATITHDTVPGDCIDRVTIQNGDRLLFERLAIPRPAPKVTLKSNWLVQQQQPQQLTLKEGLASRDLGGQSRNARRNEKRHGSENGYWKQ